MAVGVDYALFYAIRSREERRRGLGSHEALHRTARTSGRTVVVAGTTVAIAMAGLMLLVTPVVEGLHDPGVGAEALLGLALWQLAPNELLNGGPAGNLDMSLAAIVTVLVIWMPLAIGLGAWRTVTRDA
jgi:trehalose monomycolate/heme transporter